MENIEITQHVQDSYLFLAITDDDFLDYIRKAIPATFFDNSVAETIIRCCYRFFDQFKKAPKDHINHLVDYQTKELDESMQKIYDDYLTTLAYFQNVNKDYVLKSINSFLRKRELEKACMEMAKNLANNELIKGERVMYDALKNGGIEKYNVGLDYFENEVPTYYHKQKDKQLMYTGIPHLDELIGGIQRGKFIVIAGGYKGKKTWGCVHLGRMALIQGLKVLHISHEMPEDEVEMRYDMAFGSLVSSPDPQEVEYKKFNEFGEVEKTTTETRQSIYNLDTVQHYRKQGKKMGGQLKIKYYPMGTCSIDEIDRLLDYLEAVHNFKPDILINDYIEIMDLGSGNSDLRNKINSMYIHHKRIASERDITVVSVSQVTSNALQKPVIKQKDLSEDRRKLGNVDLALALSQSEEQERNGVQRVTVLVNRNGMQGVGCYMSQNINVGQICINSWPIPEEEWD